ncbi:NADP-dependent oxidoreductase [Nonomuraea sp. CA-141351]|uniref:NADP-dependent oxidoreductase n=1 Tax=Nonomuraea sp. CA-141351 TaxID=3239996 RepID=UPI003D93C303
MTGPLMTAIAQNAYGGPEVLRPVEVARPEPLPTEVLVKVHAVGLNPIDWNTRAGRGLPGVLRLPIVLGWDIAGVVEKLGPGVHTLRVGDRVFGLPWFPRQAGGCAEYVTAPSRQFVRIPDNLDFVQAAAVPLAALTAWQSLRDAARLTAGQRVLIHAAAGGVGHLAVQFARHLGAYVIGTASAAKHDLVRRLGAHEVIDYASVAFEDSVEPVDVVLDLVGWARPDTGPRSLRVLRPGGVIVTVAPGQAPELSRLAYERGVRVADYLVEPDHAALSEIAALLQQGTVRTVVDRTFTLSDIAEAHRVGERGHTAGKIVLQVAG